jgi:hypothetical protein
LEEIEKNCHFYDVKVVLSALSTSSKKSKTKICEKKCVFVCLIVYYSLSICIQSIHTDLLLVLSRPILVSWNFKSLSDNQIKAGRQIEKEKDRCPNQAKTVATRIKKFRWVEWKACFVLLKNFFDFAFVWVLKRDINYMKSWCHRQTSP